jgi:type II secretion system protein H
MQTSTAGNSTKRPHGRGARGARRRESGFTLIELALVVLLIGLFSAVSAPMLLGFGDNRLEPNARRLAGTVKYLYNEAALNGREYHLTFNLDEGTFRARVMREDGELAPVPGRWGEQTLKGDVRFQDVAVTGRGLYSSGEATSVIYPTGWLEETIIHLRQGDKVLTVRVKPFTGTSEIYEGYREF